MEGSVRKNQENYSREGQDDSDIVVNENDVLFGRGGKNNQHSGNKRLRDVAQIHKAAYNSATKKQKSEISRYIVDHMKKLDPPGRFIKTNPVTGKWEEVPDDAAREKAAQVLRDAENIDNTTYTIETSQMDQTAHTANSADSSELHNYRYNSRSYWQWLTMPPTEATTSPRTPTQYHHSDMNYTASDNSLRGHSWLETPNPDDARNNLRSYNVNRDRNANSSILRSPHIPLIEPVPLSDIHASPTLSLLRSPHVSHHDHYYEDCQYFDHKRRRGQSGRSPASSRGRDAYALSTSNYYMTEDTVNFADRSNTGARYNSSDNYISSQAFSPVNNSPRSLRGRSQGYPMPRSNYNWTEGAVSFDDRRAGGNDNISSPFSPVDCSPIPDLSPRSSRGRFQMHPWSRSNHYRPNESIDRRMDDALYSSIDDNILLSPFSPVRNDSTRQYPYDRSRSYEFGGHAHDEQNIHTDSVDYYYSRQRRDRRFSESAREIETIFANAVTPYNPTSYRENDRGGLSFHGQRGNRGMR